MNKERFKKLLTYTVPFNKALKSFVFLSVFYLFLISFTSSLVHEFRVENAQLEYQLYAAGEELASTKKAYVNDLLLLETERIEKLEFKWGNMDPDYTPQVSISPCVGRVPLMESVTYTIGYKFFEKPRKFKIVFTDSVSDLEIDLLEQIISENPDPIIGVNAEIPTSGTTTVKVYAEGIPGKNMMKAEIYAQDINGNFMQLSCEYDLHTTNTNVEGDYKRDHIRTAHVQDNYYTETLTFEGKIWEQEWDSPTECSEDEWIIKDVEYDNEYLDEGEDPQSPLGYCLTDLNEIPYLAESLTSTFRYPQINENPSINSLYRFDDDIEKITCAEEINTQLKDYAVVSVSTFQNDLGWDWHWGSSLSGDYRLVGLNNQRDRNLDKDEDEEYPHTFRYGPYATSPALFGYEDKNYEGLIEHIGHYNNPPESDFYLYEYGLLENKPLNYISFIFEIYTFTGGNHGMYAYETFNFDLNTCKRIFLKDIMSDKLLKEQGFELSPESDSLWLDLLSARLGAIWNVDEDRSTGWEDQQVDWTKGDWDKSGNWNDANCCSYRNIAAVSINDDGLTFSFQPYAVNGWAAGWPEITISWLNLWDIFTWGNWNTVENTVYEDTVILQEFVSYLDEGTPIPVEEFDLHDKIIGATYFYTDTWLSSNSKDPDYLQTEVVKQKKGTVYGLEGKYTEKDTAIVKRFVKFVNNIIGENYFSFSDNPDEVTLPVEFDNCLGRRPFGGFWSHATECSSYIGLYNIDENSIWVESDLYGKERDHVLIHELGHSIGLNHTSCFASGTLSLKSNTDDILAFSEFEIAVIDFIYSPIELVGSIENGMTYDDVVSLLGIDPNPITVGTEFCPDEIPTYIPEEEE